MTLEIPGQHGPGIRDLAAITELQGLKINSVVGAGPSVDIAVSGINVIDTIIAAFQFNRDATAGLIDFIEQTSVAVIASAGNIQLTGIGTVGDKVVVVWFDKDPDD